MLILDSEKKKKKKKNKQQTIITDPVLKLQAYQYTPVLF